jgi:hypothetical protein
MMAQVIEVLGRARDEKAPPHARPYQSGKPVTRRTLIVALAVASSVLLGACTAVRLSYNHADDILRFMAADYVGLDDRQLESFNVRVAHLHDWHRANELPRYVELLQSASGRLSKGLQSSDVDWAAQALRARYRLLAGRAVEEAAPILSTLDHDQLAALEKKFSRNNTRFSRQWLPGDQRKRERRLIERTRERVEEWTGPLNAAQRKRIEDFARAHPRLMEIRLAERQRWQREAVETIRRHRNPSELAPRLAGLLTDPEAGRSDEYLRENRRWQADVAQLVLDLDRTLTAEQRERALRRMNRYAEDFRALAGAKGMASERPRAVAGS